MAAKVMKPLKNMVRAAFFSMIMRDILFSYLSL